MVKMSRRRNGIYECGENARDFSRGRFSPFDVDDNGDVVYKFNKEMYKRNAEKS